jgi:protein-disulfide isomerase
VGVLGGLVLLSRGAQLNVDNVNVEQHQDASADSGNIADHVFGDPSAPVTVIEYGDYQCPGCGSAAPVLKEVSEKYKDKGVAFIFRNFPLSTIHPNALAAASAAEAAGLQGKFWEMHNKLYDNQAAWENLSSSDRTNLFVNYAGSLGIDTEKFKTDITSDAVSKKIEYDTALGKKAGVQGTPTIYVNGELVSDTRIKDGKKAPANDTSSPFVWSTAENFTKYVIEPALKKANETK